MLMMLMYLRLMSVANHDEITDSMACTVFSTRYGVDDMGIHTT